MQETVRYNYRLRPGAQAEAHLMSEWHRSRWLWNECVHQFRTGKGSGKERLSKLLTAARAQSPWLRDGARTPQEQTLRAFAIALDRSFKIRGIGRPRIKKRKTAQPSLQYQNNAFRIRDGRLVLANCPARIPVVWSRELPSDPKMMRVFRDSIGHWYVSFVVRRDAVEVPETGGAIGIDWGVRAVATTTDERYDLPHAQHRRLCAAQLAKAQRKMSRRHRPGLPASHGYMNAQREAAKVHKKAARQNQHTARVWAARVVADHQLIAVEDFRPRFLASTTMARKAADSAIATTKQELIERAKRAGRELVIVPPAYTTMTCSNCDARTKQRLELSQRTFRCENCGYIADRDRNAARTILATARRNRVGADGVRRSTTSVIGAA